MTLLSWFLKSWFRSQASVCEKNVHPETRGPSCVEIRGDGKRWELRSLISDNNVSSKWIDFSCPGSLWETLSLTNRGKRGGRAAAFWPKFIDLRRGFCAEVLFFMKRNVPFGAPKRCICQQIPPSELSLQSGLCGEEILGSWAIHPWHQSRERRSALRRK